MIAGLENLTVQGIPAHPLVVHALVVGVPVMALAGWVMVFRAPWRASWAWVIAVVDILLAVVSVVARATGEGLQAALSSDTFTIAEEHSELGNVAPLFVGAMAVGAVAFALLRGRGRTPLLIGGAALVVTSAAAVVWVVLVGHSGASSTWGGITLG